MARMPGAFVYDTFGSSESGTFAKSTSGTGNTPAQGRFAPREDAVVLDDELRPVSPGSGVIGRLARGGPVALGYYNDPEKTAATFPVIDGVRYIVTGDHATVEADGTIQILGRGSACINTGGEKVYPDEVEGALKSHPGVADAMVVGLPDERFGERVVALVVVRGRGHPRTPGAASPGRPRRARPPTGRRLQGAPADLPGRGRGTVPVRQARLRLGPGAGPGPGRQGGQPGQHLVPQPGVGRHRRAAPVEGGHRRLVGAHPLHGGRRRARADRRMSGWARHRSSMSSRWSRLRPSTIEKNGRTSGERIPCRAGPRPGSRRAGPGPASTASWG